MVLTPLKQFQMILLFFIELICFDLSITNLALVVTVVLIIFSIIILFWILMLIVLKKWVPQHMAGICWIFFFEILPQHGPPFLQPALRGGGIFLWAAPKTAGSVVGAWSGGALFAT